MPTCRKCGKLFPNRIKIQGKIHVLNNRKFCLDCSPFGGRNTKSDLDAPRTKTCLRCKKTYIWDRKKGHRKTLCGSCNANQKRKEKKAKAIQYKGGVCKICGYSRCLDALVFHHRNPEEKDFPLATSYLCRSWNALKLELDKCDLLCCRCHAEIHAGIIGS